MYPVQLELPPSVKGQGPTMATLVEVAHILEAAKREAPMSLAEIGRRMEAKQTRHATVKACVDFLCQLGYVVQGSKGALWAYHPKAQDLLKRARRL
jgi:hypothetical protein